MLVQGRLGQSTPCLGRNNLSCVGIHIAEFIKRPYNFMVITKTRLDTQRKTNL